METIISYIENVFRNYPDSEKVRKAKEDQWKRRPYCGKTENQIKAGYNGSASQRMADAAPARRNLDGL